MWIMRVPVISTSHLTPETLNAPIDIDNKGISGTNVVRINEGVMFQVEAYENSLLRGDPLPKDLRAVFAWARLLAYNWVRFDPDGVIVHELPTYEHQ